MPSVTARPGQPPRLTRRRRPPGRARPARSAPMDLGARGRRGCRRPRRRRLADGHHGRAGALRPRLDHPLGRARGGAGLQPGHDHGHRGDHLRRRHPAPARGGHRALAPLRRAAPRGRAGGPSARAPRLHPDAAGGRGERRRVDGGRPGRGDPVLLGPGRHPRHRGGGLHGRARGVRGRDLGRPGVVLGDRDRRRGDHARDRRALPQRAVLDRHPRDDRHRAAGPDRPRRGRRRPLRRRELDRAAPARRRRVGGRAARARGHLGHPRGPGRRAGPGPRPARAGPDAPAAHRAVPVLGPRRARPRDRGAVRRGQRVHPHGRPRPAHQPLRHARGDQVPGHPRPGPRGPDAPPLGDPAARRRPGPSQPRPRASPAVAADRGRGRGDGRRHGPVRRAVPHRPARAGGAGPGRHPRPHPHRLRAAPS